MIDLGINVCTLAICVQYNVVVTNIIPFSLFARVILHIFFFVTSPTEDLMEIEEENENENEKKATWRCKRTAHFLD